VNLLHASKQWGGASAYVQRDLPAWWRNAWRVTPGQDQQLWLKSIYILVLLENGRSFC